MPFRIPKDSEVRSMIDGNDGFDILKELRDRTIRATVLAMSERFLDVSNYAASQYADTLINNLHDYTPSNHNPFCVSYKGGYHVVDTSKE